MAEVVELVPKEAVGKVGETRKPKTGRFRLMAIAKAQREAAVEQEPTAPPQVAAVEAEAEKPVDEQAPAAAGQRGQGLSTR